MKYHGELDVHKNEVRYVKRENVQNELYNGKQ